VRTQLTSTRPAVLVLDMQSVFIGADGPFDNPAVVGAVNTFLPRARGAGLPVIVSCYTLRDDLSDVGLLAGQPFIEDMRRGAPRAAVDPRVEVADSDLVCHHNRPSAFFRSDLEHVLKTLGSRAIILTGVSINNAVSSTARDAFARDIPAVVVKECVAPAPWEEQVDVYLSVVDTWGAEVAGADEVLTAVN
jgi:nicotinamidase-related amidase